MEDNSKEFINYPSKSKAQSEMERDAIACQEIPAPTVPTTAASRDLEQDVTINSRAYQLEMLEESLKRNIIVTMDTGSGKTHVSEYVAVNRAVLRIKKELESASAESLIWFLTPTVELCSQQFRVLQSQISSVQIKSFTSVDNVDKWTEKSDWDTMLFNVNIVVSTYAVLHDALCHGFVNTECLALIVFDEVLAHNCIGHSPGSKIMRDFYWPRKKEGHPVPHILGLTASPVIGSKLCDLEALELLLDSTCKSPRVQKEDLLLYVHRPNLMQVPFEGNKLTEYNANRTRAMESLVSVYQGLRIHDDPEIVRLRTEDTETSRNQMGRLLKSKKTFIQDQIKSFIRRSRQIFRALGGWAADFYISQVIWDCIQSANSKDHRFLRWEDSEKRYLASVLRFVDITPRISSVPPEESISHKVHALISFLHSCDDNTVGIIFTKERAIAYMLQRLLSNHPETCNRLRFETVVGASQRPRGKRDICEVSSPDNALTKFRAGEINIIIATSVLEEGIDIPQCKLVICFDEPSSLKSYIQCRGRARLPESQWVVLVDTASDAQTLQWEELEREMKLRYKEEERSILNFAEAEAKAEQSEAEQRLSRQFRVQSTGALLDMDSAKGHLQCFCSRLSSYSSLEMRPEYIIIEEEKEKHGKNEQPLLSAKVILPATLDYSLRTHKSKLLWRSEKSATKDAAFEAYIALYRAELVNDNLLPINSADYSRYMDKEDSLVEICAQFNPWPRVARAWRSKQGLQQRNLCLKDQDGLTKCNIEMSVPVDLPNIAPIPIYWDASVQWKIEFGLPTNIRQSEMTTDHTKSLLLLAYGHRWEVEDMRHVIIFKARDIDINQTQLGGISLIEQRCMDNPVGLLRDPQYQGHPYIFHSWIATKPKVVSIEVPHKDYRDFPDDQPFVALRKWPRRLDFLHRVTSNPEPGRREYYRVLPQSFLEMDTVPAAYSQFGLLIPSILRKVEVQLVVEELCVQVLANMNISNRELIRTAISTPMAREDENYQKLEFLGDSILKFLVSVFVASTYPIWPEGYLSAKKDTIVSNSRLCKAAIDCGLDKFILTTSFTGRKWRPLYVEKVLGDQEEGTREISCKTIADVIESLIGAGWKMGDYSTSLSVAKAFLPELNLPSIEVASARLFELALDNIPLPANLLHLEKLAGYSFKKKSLLVEAMSHRSDRTANSYERLEFIGDSILEIIVVTELMAYEDKLSHSLMHLYKAAIVNGDYLGFIALEWNITQKRTHLEEDLKSGRMKEVDSFIPWPLWRFMSHASFDIGNQQCEAERRHSLLRRDILDAITSGADYPWTLLAKLRVNKFFSDIVESLLGAVWVDSGSMDECREILRRMGILRYLHRIIEHSIHVLHPREELSILANDKEVKYDVHFKSMDDGSKEWACTVFIGETQVSNALQGVSSDEVRTRAAEMAIASLKSVNGSLGSSIPYREQIFPYQHG